MELEMYHEGVPSDLHPAAMRGAGPALAATKQGLEAAYRGVGTILDVEKSVKDGPTLYNSAMPVFENSIRHVGGAIDAVGKLIKSHEAAIASQLSLKPGEAPLAAEIRAHYKSAKSPMTAIIQSLRSGDAVSARAALQGPAFLSGLTTEQQTELRKIAALTLAPEAVQHLETAVKGKAKLERALEYVTETARKRKAAWVPTTAELHRLREIAR